MCKMADCHLVLDDNIGQKRTFVVDAEGEDAVLIRNLKACLENGAIHCLGRWFKIEAVIGRQHSEFKLKSIAGRKGQRSQMVV